MRLLHILLNKLASQVPKSVERRSWNIPGKKKKREIKLSQYIKPKELYQRLINAPTKSYYYAIAIIFGFGLSGILTQFISFQRSLHKEEYVKSAMQILGENQALVNLIGVPYKIGLVTPITKDGLQQNSVNVFIKIEGKKADGVIACHAQLEDDKWDIKKMEFRFVDEAGGIVRLVKDKTD